MFLVTVHSLVWPWACRPSKACHWSACEYLHQHTFRGQRSHVQHGRFTLQFVLLNLYQPTLSALWCQEEELVLVCSGVLDAVSGGHQPTLIQHRRPTDMSCAPDVEADLPGPLTLLRRLTAHDARAAVRPYPTFWKQGTTRTLVTAAITLQSDALRVSACVRPSYGSSPHRSRPHSPARRHTPGSFCWCSVRSCSGRWTLNTAAAPELNHRRHLISTDTLEVLKKVLTRKQPCFLHLSHLDSSDPSEQSSFPSHLNFSRTQRLFLQENSPGLHFPTKNKEYHQWDLIVGYYWICSCCLEPTTVFFISVVSTIIRPVTLPELWFTAAIFTHQLRSIALWSDTQRKTVCSSIFLLGSWWNDL